MLTQNKKNCEDVRDIKEISLSKYAFLRHMALNTHSMHHLILKIYLSRLEKKLTLSTKHKVHDRNNAIKAKKNEF